MTEIKSITGQDLYSNEYKNNLLESYGKFYREINDKYLDDEYLQMAWLPNISDVMKFDKKNPCHPLDFTKKVQFAEKEKDDSELERIRNLHKYDKKISDDELKLSEAYYRIRELERNLVWDKSDKIKKELLEQKNILDIYNKKTNETSEQEINSNTTTTI